MDEITYQILPSLTILAIGLVFGFLMGMLYYYQTIAALKAQLKEQINKCQK